MAPTLQWSNDKLNYKKNSYKTCMYSKYGLIGCKIGEDTTTITNLNSLRTSWGIGIPRCSSTIRSDSTSFFFAMGSIPLQIISWMQSHALSRRTSTDIYRSNRLSKCKNKTMLNNSFYWHENKTLHTHLPCTSKNFNDVQVLATPGHLHILRAQKSSWTLRVSNYNLWKDK